MIRFLRFKAFSNLLYVSLELAAERGPRADTLRKVPIDNFVLMDHIKRAFALSQHAKSLAGYFPEHSVEYMDIRAQLKCYAKELLSHCNNSEEVQTLLTLIPEDSGDSATFEFNYLFMSALRQEQKPFAGHPYHQHLLRLSPQEGAGFNSTSGVFTKFFSILMAQLVFLLNPAVILVDSLFREGTILMEHPKDFKIRKQNSQDGPENPGSPGESSSWHFFQTQMHSTICRIWRWSSSSLSTCPCQSRGSRTKAPTLTLSNLLWILSCTALC